jgi:hypothetical protein
VQNVVLHPHAHEELVHATFETEIPSPPDILDAEFHAESILSRNTAKDRGRRIRDRHAQQSPALVDGKVILALET